MSERLFTLYELLEKNVRWQWYSEFSKAKQCPKDMKALMHFDPSGVAVNAREIV